MSDSKRAKLVELRKQLHDEALRLANDNARIASSNEGGLTNVANVICNKTEIVANRNLISLIDILLISEND